MIDRKGVKSVFADVFLTNVSDSGQVAAFENMFNDEILRQQHMFGHPCDIIASGSIAECGHNFANLSIGMLQASSTIREASRVQMCRRLIAQEGLLNTLVNRIKGSDLTPTAESLQRVIQLFYPAWGENDEIIKTLLNLDFVMASRSEAIKDRWRLMILTVCESPYWQIL